MANISAPDANGDRTLTYAALRINHPDYSKQKCRDMAGFSPYYPPSVIEASQKYLDIRTRTMDAAAAEGVDPAAVFQTLKRSMDRSSLRTDGACDSSANQAAKIAGEFLGMQAPVQVNANVQQQVAILMQLLPNSV
jgi:hypothetical protein